MREALVTSAIRSAQFAEALGLPGDRIEMRQGQLFINDRAASLKPDGMGSAEDDSGGGEPAYRYIETLPNGDQVLRNAQNVVRGYYEAEGDHTRDENKNIVAKGNKLRSMIC